MSTTLTTLPAGQVLTRSVEPKANPQTVSKVKILSTNRKMIVGAILFLAALVTWWSVSMVRGSAKSAQVDKHIVTPRTFSVLLKEKGELKAFQSTDITCEVEGKSTIINLIPEGTAVKEGDLLVELASDEIVNKIRTEELKEANAIASFEAARAELDIQRDKNASDIRKAELEIELKQLELEKYEKGDWKQKHRDYEIAIEQAEIGLQRAGENFDASKKLFERNFITKIEHDLDEFNFKKAEWDVEKSKNALGVLEQYSHVADLRKLSSDLDEAIKEADRVHKNAEAEETKKARALEGKEKELALTQDQLAKLRLQKEKCVVLAPTQGFVVYGSAEGGGRMFMMDGSGQIKVGATVFERQVLMQLPDTSKMTVIVRIHEAKTDKLHMGQSAVVEVEGLPGRQFAGKVTKIAVVADTQNRWLNPDLKEYETEITLEPSQDPLKPGVTAHAQIFVETIADQLAVPVQSVYSKGGKRFVFRQQGGEPKPIEVHLGATGTEWAQITEGLTEGNEILLAFTDEHKRLIPEVAGNEGGKKRLGPGGPPNGSATSAEGGPPTKMKTPRGPRGDGASHASGPSPKGTHIQKGPEGTVPANATPAAPAAAQPQMQTNGHRKESGDQKPSDQKTGETKDESTTAVQPKEKNSKSEPGQSP